ncbi:MAG: DUF433 domain-containing protein [Saprospiraceae bacterium]|nr:DUF433 domain-containing protein [Saprospiraceae bacterium]
MQELIKRITIDPEVCHGKPTVRGSRLMVATVLELMASDMTVDEILADYPALELADIKACLQYAAMLAKFQSIPLEA